MTNSQIETWNQTKQWYYDKYGIEPSLVELAADLDILRLCASGSSNESISRFLGLPYEDGIYQPIENLLDSYFGFRGWKKDLPFSPLAIYKELENPFGGEFVDVIIYRYGHNMNMDLKNMYESASIFANLERLLNEKWI